MKFSWSADAAAAAPSPSETSRLIITFASQTLAAVSPLARERGRELGEETIRYGQSQKFSDRLLILHSNGGEGRRRLVAIAS